MAPLLLRLMWAQQSLRLYHSGSRSIYPRHRNVDVRLVIDDDAARFALVRWLPHKIRGFVGARFKAVICFFQEWLS